MSCWIGRGQREEGTLHRPQVGRRRIEESFGPENLSPVGWRRSKLLQTQRGTPRTHVARQNHRKSNLVSAACCWWTSVCVCVCVCVCERERERERGTIRHSNSICSKMYAFYFINSQSPASSRPAQGSLSTGLPHYSLQAAVKKTTFLPIGTSSRSSFLTM